MVDVGKLYFIAVVTVVRLYCTSLGRTEQKRNCRELSR